MADERLKTEDSGRGSYGRWTAENRGRAERGALPLMGILCRLSLSVGFLPLLTVVFPYRDFCWGGVVRRDFC